MQKYSARKILSTVFFILIFVFTFLAFKKENIQEVSYQDMIYFSGILISALILLTLNFSSTTIVKTVYEDQKKGTKRKKTNDTQQKEQLARKQMEKSSKAIISDIQKHTDINKLSESLLIKFAHEFATVQGIAYIRDKGKNSFSTAATYALYGKTDGFSEGIGINGQIAISKKPKLITEIPENYITVISGLGSSSPANLLVLPFVHSNETIALIELAAFDEFPKFIIDIYNKINDSIAKKFNELNQ